MPNLNNGTIGKLGYGREKSVEQNVELLISDGTDVTYFIELLSDISDPRDNRGKIHELSFVLAVTTMAILSGKNYVSEIHRYIHNKIEWLQEIFDRPDAKPISRAQLPRIIAIVDWEELNAVIEEFFGVTVENINDEWVAIDGKVLRGTITDNDNAHENEQITIAIGHKSQQILFQRKMSGAKSSEVAEVRKLLEETWLQRAKVTLDPLHANPTTLETINQSGGKYIVQIKKNQPTLFEMFGDMAQEEKAIGSIKTVEKSRGRIEEREGRFFSLKDVEFDARWDQSDFQTLIVVDRMTKKIKKEEISRERSYYVSNVELEDHQSKISTDMEEELFTAIREHWHVESNNYIRDMTFKEDYVKTKNKNQGQILSLVRTVVINIIRKTNPKNFKEVIASFCDSQDVLASVLLKFNFLRSWN
jgi:predicted transposase YbfD/YdcC